MMPDYDRMQRDLAGKSIRELRRIARAEGVPFGGGVQSNASWGAHAIVHHRRGRALRELERELAKEEAE